MTKVLIIGSGGREHALGYSISQHPIVSEVLYALGNAGTEEGKGRNLNIDGTKKENFGTLADIVERESVDKIIVGPERPLVDGIVDFFNERGFFNIFGPTKAASQIEADKFYSYVLMKKLVIPQAESMLCYTIDEAEGAIKKMSTKSGIVIKARGLTSGKGVYVCDSKEEALTKLKQDTNVYGPEVLIAERLFGREASIFGISDGERVKIINVAIRDYKRLLDNDKGPNTGGMGSYGPVSFISDANIKYIESKIMNPIIRAMKGEGREYKGVLYAGVILTQDGLNVLEFNCRLGDPEAQVLTMLVDNLYEPITAALEGRIDKIELETKEGNVCCVVMASNGYPGAYNVGLLIGGLEEVSKMPDVKVFHAGTKKENGRVVTAGGRALGVTAYDEYDIIKAQVKAYTAVATINTETDFLNDKNSKKRILTHRRDIGEDDVRHLYEDP